ncbi:MAG: M1 family metallopeptidase [Bacteroidia bacterium]|nr:M1 family metallopeptidase [Bacteroidia bacterium]
MKKYLVLIAVLFFSLSSAFAQLGEYRSAENSYYWKSRKPFEGYWQQDVNYTIKATLIDSLDVIDAIQDLVYYNNSPDTLNEVYFHLYQNAFLKGGYLESLNKTNNFYQRFGKYESYGKGTEIESFKVLGSVSNDTLNTFGEGNAITLIPMIDYSIMRVTLTQPVMPNSSVTFQIKFKTYFDDGGNQRRRMKLYGAYGYKHYNGVHWYPRICVYDRKFGWETDQHLGKEFYGDFGTYHVELTMPSHYVMDATGLLLNKDEVLPKALREKLDIKNFANKPLEEKPSEIIPIDGSYKTWKFRSINTHDFAWTADPTYRIGEVNLPLPNGNVVQCIALAQEPHAARWQDAALFCAKVVELYSKDFGMYAYPKMIVADAQDGMEYPMLTLDGGLSPGYYGLFAHEIGHNWFFGMVGNNETYRASLDEGFTQFLTHWSMTRLTNENPKTNGKGYVAKHYKPLPLLDQNIYWGYLRDAINGSDMPLNTHSDDFSGALGHGGGYSHVYYKTATMLYNLQYVLGNDLFHAAMRNYFEQWKMCHPYFEDFRNSIIQFTHVDLNWFFDQWMETTKTIDYAIQGSPQNIKDNNGKPTDYYLIKLKRKGTMQMPIDLMAYSKNGKIYTTTISNTYFLKDKNKQQYAENTWRGWGVLNKKYTVKIYCPDGMEKISIDTTYRLADINQLNNSSKFPYKLTFDSQIRSTPNRRYYLAKWRPDIWYNQLDGIKAGLHFNGNYMNYKHLFRATIWYNTTIGQTQSFRSFTPQPIHYSFSYTNNFPTNFNYSIQSRYLDGLWMHKLGVNKTIGRNGLSAYFKSMYRYSPSDLQYLLYSAAWNSNQYNNTINLEYTRNYVFKQGNGQVVLGLKSTTLGSDYDYAALHLTAYNNVSFGKFDLRTRTFLQYMHGANIAPESKLYTAGANNEQLMDDKFLRSQMVVPSAWLGYGVNVNHLHAGGGLNIRGYAGYLLPTNNNGIKYFTYAGSSGASINAELELDRLVKFEPAKLKKYFHLDVYLFGDAGVLQHQFKTGEVVGLTSNQTVTTNLLFNGGIGTALTIKRWGVLDEVKPLTLRLDFPLVINHTPFVDGQFVGYRWIVGISRAF